MRRPIYLLMFVMLAVLLLLMGCSSKDQSKDGDGAASSRETADSYRQISQEEAMRMMENDDGHIVVDVRRRDEYDAGHIPGAVLIPNESIGTERPEELPDLEQVILIYCRSGNRSKQAAQKLFDMGYSNIYEFGGINTWTGDIVTEESSETETPSGEG